MNPEWVTFESFCERIDEVQRILQWYCRRKQYHTMRKAISVSGDEFDVYQILIERMLTYLTKRSRKLKLSTYVCYMAKTRMLNTIRNQRDLNRYRVGTEARSVPKFPEGIRIYEQRFEDVDNRDEVTRLLRTIEWRQAVIVKGRHWGEVTLKKIGEKLGISRERVRQIEAKAMHSLSKNAELLK